MTTPMSSETTMTTISGARPEPMIQSTRTCLRLSSANAMTSPTSTSIAPARASSLRLRRSAGCLPRGDGVCAEGFDIARTLIVAHVRIAVELRLRRGCRAQPLAGAREVLDAERGGDVERHAVAEEVVDAFAVGAG